MMRPRLVIRAWLMAVLMLPAAVVCSPAQPNTPAPVTAAELESLRLAIGDLIDSFGPEYPHGRAYLNRLKTLQAAGPVHHPSARKEFHRLKEQALLANPLLDFDRLLLLKRKRGQLGLPVNHKCNSGIPKTGYDNEIAVLSPVAPEGTLHTLFRPPDGRFVGEIDLNFDADRLLFTMPDGRAWQIHEIRTDGTGLRQISRGEHPDVDNFDGCYLPDGGIAFASTASYHAVPCWHGKERACGIYRMEADGSRVRQLCFDQDLDLFDLFEPIPLRKTPRPPVRNAGTTGGLWLPRLSGPVDQPQTN